MEEEAALLVAAAGSAAALDELVRRRIEGRPLEYLLGWVEFCGLRLALDDGVFVPRRRTEFLVRCAAEEAEPGAVVADLCCGCGAVGAALAAAVPAIELHAVDLDAAAVRCARRNLAAVGGHVHRGDLCRPLPAALRGRVAVMVANAPYVPTAALATMPPEARLHEPRGALDGGDDGLGLYRRLAAAAPRWLAPGGRLLVETAAGQATRAQALFSGAGLIPRIRRSGEFDATVVEGVRP